MTLQIVKTELPKQFWYAVSDGDAQRVARQLQNGRGSRRHCAEGDGTPAVSADVVAADGIGKTALHRAALFSSARTLATLLAHGATASSLDEHELTASCHAARYGKLDAVRTLLDADGVHQYPVGPSGLLCGVLDEAVAQDREEVVALILEKVKAADGDTTHLDLAHCKALLIAARGRKWEIARLLAQASSSLETRDADGKTLLFHAVERRLLHLPPALHPLKPRQTREFANCCEMAADLQEALAQQLGVICANKWYTSAMFDTLPA